MSPSAVHTTYRAVQTWRQAYARTADVSWRAPLRRGEVFLRQAAGRLLAEPQTASLQDVNFAALGLIEAGAGRDEPMVKELRAILVSRQNDDGGWGFVRTGSHSNAYATGQTLYAFRMLGMSDGDRLIRRGTAWLIEQQKDDGNWSTRGSGKAGAMWGVLGLVSIDVASLTVSGIEDGQHVAGTLAITAAAAANVKGGVQQLELRIDDLSVHLARGERLAWSWDTAGLEEGPHLVDLIATTAGGGQARRQFVV